MTAVLLEVLTATSSRLGCDGCARHWTEALSPEQRERLWRQAALRASPTLTAEPTTLSDAATDLTTSTIVR